MKEKKLELIMTLLLLFTAFLLSKTSVLHVSNSKTEIRQKEVVIDAGHGGFDPGKIGINGAKEKDINLAIALDIEKNLKKKKVKVILTRREDTQLCSEDSYSKKVEDMKKRCEIIDSSNARLTVSIHQNSYHEESIQGAQVFYYQHSTDGEKIAQILQKNMSQVLNPKKNRKAKANDSYYLLRKTKIPTVIVECGFLSNYEEAQKLISEAYQKKIAEAVTNGIVEYLNSRLSDKKN